MTKKTLLTAQGGGFYGMSILTTEMPTSDVVQAVQNVGGKFVESEELSSFLFPGENETMVRVLEIKDDLQAPLPVVLMDTGNSEEEMEILTKILARIK
jgi:hypothetical protein